MKKALFVLAALVSTPAFATGLVSVRGYTKSNGTYVAPHVRTAPDNTVTNNFSYQPKTVSVPSTSINMGSFAPTYGSGKN